MPTPLQYDFCKPEDWQEMAESWREAAEFLERRSMYRESLELRRNLVVTSPLTEPAMHNAIHARLSAIEKTISGKPQPPTARTNADLANKHMLEHWGLGEDHNLLSADIQFFASLDEESRRLILREAAYQMKEESTYDEGVKSLYDATLAILYATKPPEPPPGTYHMDGITSVTYPTLKQAVEKTIKWLEDHRGTVTNAVIDDVTGDPVVTFIRDGEDYRVHLWRDLEDCETLGEPYTKWPRVGD